MTWGRIDGARALQLRAQGYIVRVWLDGVDVTDRTIVADDTPGATRIDIECLNGMDGHRYVAQLTDVDITIDGTRTL
jgi:hypothetical protein